MSKQRTNQINTNIYQRNVPTQPLQSSFSPRPVKTRQVLFPVLDCHQPSNTKILHYPTYNQQTQFNPGSSAPYSGWATNIDDDSKVKSLFRTTQKCIQNEYIPSSTSDMYIQNKNIPSFNHQHEQQTLGMRNLLFKQQQFSDFNPNTCNLGQNTFNNHTRQQLKDI